MKISRYMPTLNDIHTPNELRLSDRELKIIEDALRQSRWSNSSLRLKIQDYMKGHRITVTR